MASNTPRVPVRFLQENQDLLKSQESLAGGQAGATDYKRTEDVPSRQMVSSFNAPADRNLSNVLFRRNPDGSLHVENAKNVVVDAIRKVRDKVQLNSLEEAALSCVFPQLFNFVDSALLDSVRRVHLRVTPEECSMLAVAVATHLQAEASWNSGLGGFPTTRSDKL